MNLKLYMNGDGGKQLYTQILKEQMQEVLEGAKGLAKESLGRLMKFEDIFSLEDFLLKQDLCLKH